MDGRKIYLVLSEPTKTIKLQKKLFLRIILYTIRNFYAFYTRD